MQKQPTTLAEFRLIQRAIYQAYVCCWITWKEYQRINTQLEKLINSFLPTTFISPW